MKQRSLFIQQIIPLIIVSSIFLLMAFAIPVRRQSVIVHEINSSSLLVLVNKERISVGVKPLSMVGELTKSSIAKANDLIKNKYWDHNRPDGAKFSKVIFQYLPDAIKVGENLAKCYDSLDAEFNALKNSPEHYKNMIDKDYQLYGDASIEENNCIYTVQHFAQIGKS